MAALVDTSVVVVPVPVPELVGEADDVTELGPDELAVTDAAATAAAAAAAAPETPTSPRLDGVGNPSPFNAWKGT